MIYQGHDSYKSSFNDLLTACLINIQRINPQYIKLYQLDTSQQ